MYVFLFFFPFYSGTILEHLTLIYIDLQNFTNIYNILQSSLMFHDVSNCFHMFPEYWVAHCFFMFFHVFSMFFLQETLCLPPVSSTHQTASPKRLNRPPQKSAMPKSQWRTGAWQPRPCTVHHKSMCQDSHGFSSARLERPRHDPEKRHWSQALDFLLMSKPTSIDTQSDTGSQHGSAGAQWPRGRSSKASIN